MHTIVNSECASHLLSQFREWVESEWGNVDSFKPEAGSINFPLPILALEQNDLIGGLSFTCHAKHDTESIGVWINTLYIAPKYRNRGIGVDLVKAAYVEASALNIEELFVFTELPIFYEKLGWEYVNSVKDSVVLRKLLLN